jgi:quinol monooxygenase YgiN
MLIVAGHVTVDPEQREAHIAGFTRIAERARQADGCLDFTIAADALDPGRIHLFERWESREAVSAFRRRAPRPRHPTALRSVSVAEYDVAGARLRARPGRRPRGGTLPGG